MADSFSVKLNQAVEPFVLSLDVGSTGTRGGLFDVSGRPVAGTRLKVDHSFRTNGKGRSEIDPDQIVSEVAAVLDAVARPEFAGKIAAVCLDTFATAVVGVDEDGAAITPCFTYADSRPSKEIKRLRSLLSEEGLQQRTGTRFHASYLPARLSWLRRTQPDTFDLVSTWMSLGEYVYLRIIGARGTSMISAAWTGLLNRHTGEWDAETLEVLGVSPSSLAPIHLPNEPFTEIPKRVGKRWPALKEAQWFASIPDGLASTLGPGTDPTTITLASSTSGAMRMLVPGVPGQLPSGLWCYRVDSGRSLVGGALNDVGRVVSWLDALIAMPHRRSREEWMQGPPLESSPIVLPYLSGERSTGWRGDARAVISEVSDSTDAQAFYRGCMEGVAMSYRRVAEQLEEITPHVSRVVATGGISQSFPAWLEILANVLGTPVTPKALKRSTLRGAALYVLEQIAPDVPRAAPQSSDIIEPTVAWAREYDARYARFLALYDDVVG